MIKTKTLFCYLRAVPFFLKSGIWCPHIYKDESKEKAIIISTDNGFRVSNNWLHNDNERVHTNATLIRSRCIHCGKEELSWYDKEPEVIG